jgi:glycine dehydrogenase
MTLTFDTTYFTQRHVGVSAEQGRHMLKTLGLTSIDGLIDQALPRAIRQKDGLELGVALSETQLLEKMKVIAARNTEMVSLIGQGYYDTILPPVIQRNVLESPAWYTAYTPYQPEISQGRLEALLNFQTVIIDLTGLAIANASLLDEGTAAAEAMAMARRIAPGRPATFFVDADCHPQTIAVVRTRAEPLGWTVQVGDPSRDLEPSAVFGTLLQYPSSSGGLHDPRPIIERVKKADGVTVLAADPLALMLVASPGELGADVAVGSTQRFGVPMGYGGPHAAYIATRPEYQRMMPGRLVGVTIDSRGNLAYRLALQTREQHIRREKATSNICTAQVLLAIIASMYCVYHGPDGLRHIARRVAGLASILGRGLQELGFTLTSESYFDTVTVDTRQDQDTIIARALALGLNLRRYPKAGAFAGNIGVSCDETTTPDVIKRVWRAFVGEGKPLPSFDSLAGASDNAIPTSLARKSDFMRHPVFHRYRSETEMLRYLRRLSDRDLALDRTMIPLGSCTMKLNATAEMMPLTWSGFARIHPYAPADQVQGYADLITDLKEKLCIISGYDAASLQPNSGAQGEYAGLLAIRAYHRSRGELKRTVCLIPTSAHGTNPASAQMAGMEVVAVTCDAAGNVDVDDLRLKVDKYADRLAALMITYPSTHGVYEEAIGTICDIVHAAGGQVYLDGANLTAMVGLSKPGECGADVSHFNLHKTFCIPHGGGGPGMGPIGVKKHLVPYLPSDPQTFDGSSGVGPVSAAPYGSASILTIAWAYILMMGGAGLTEATRQAILSANYVAHRLSSHYPILFRGTNNRVAHECIVDIRPFKDSSGVTVDDVAKRLIDHGFHAPTMSFPVPGTLMIEPTESESLTEIDRFCDAMISIRKEIRDIETDKMSKTDNPLKNAPHTIADLIAPDWKHGYSREIACFPNRPSVRAQTDKYWSPVNRIDGVYGDRNLVCACPPMEEYAEVAS